MINQHDAKSVEELVQIMADTASIDFDAALARQTAGVISLIRAADILLTGEDDGIIPDGEFFAYVDMLAASHTEQFGCSYGEALADFICDRAVELVQLDSLARRRGLALAFTPSPEATLGVRIADSSPASTRSH